MLDAGRGGLLQGIGLIGNEPLSLRSHAFIAILGGSNIVCGTQPIGKRHWQISLRIMELIGFDARVSRATLINLWPEERKSRYLIQPSCEVPLSVDFVSWPSVFDSGIGSGLSSEHRGELGLSSTSPGSRFGINFPFWDEIVDLEAALLRIPKEHQIIKVERLSKQVAHPDWILEGFDVADEGFTSAVTNTSSPSLDNIKLQFRSKINGNGLFADHREAEMYASSALRVLSEVPSLRVMALFTLKVPGLVAGR